MKVIATVVICLTSLVANAQIAEDYYKKAVVKYKMKDYGGAIVEYTRAIELGGNSPVLYNNRGVCKYKMEHYSEAIEDYNMAISSDSNFVNAYFNKGNSYLDINELEDALISYDRAIYLDSLYVKAYINRAKVYYLLEDYRSTVTDLTKVLDENVATNKEGLHLERGNALFKLAEFNKALSDYTVAIQLKTNFYQAYINRGQCHIQLKDHLKAIDDFTLSMHLNMDGGESYYYRGLTYLDMTTTVKASDRKMKTLRMIRKNQNLIELACSDFDKSKALGYGRSFEVIEMYCK
ncbi:MAG: hypothetical protein COA58_02655 [Bacteroidetes bacterium]|nr:MAG: hypothetical protein COA58_02655 [Bacteroidota bacterium]